MAASNKISDAIKYAKEMGVTGIAKEAAKDISNQVSSDYNAVKNGVGKAIDAVTTGNPVNQVYENMKKKSVRSASIKDEE